MALEKMMVPPANAPRGTPLTDEEELDLKIATLMGQQMIDKGGAKVIETAVAQSRDPGQVIGQFMMQLGQQLLESMPEDMALSPKILLARGGWVEQISDYIQEQYDVKKEIMDKAEIYVASTATEMANVQQQKDAAGGQPVPPPVPNPAMPAPIEGEL